MNITSCEPMVGCTSFALSLFGIALFFIYVVWFSTDQMKMPRYYLFLTNIFLVISSIFYLITFFLKYKDDPNHIYNLIGLSILSIIISGFRSIIDYFDSKNAKENYFPYIKQNFRDGMWNIVFFLATYSSIIYAKDIWFRWSGYLLCFFNIFRYFKYRFWDDLINRSMKPDISYLGHKSNPNIVLTQGLFNLLLRTYLFVAYSFGCVYMLMFLGDSNPTSVFNISETAQSQNILVDFMYFSIITMSTVGYGDMSPVSVNAKFICMFQIISGYLFIGSIFGLIIGRYQPIK